MGAGQLVLTPRHVAHVFPYDPNHLGHGVEAWSRSQLSRWPLAAVARSRLAERSSVHVIGRRSATVTRSPLLIRTHGSLTSGPRLREWGDDWSAGLGRYLRRLGTADVVVLHLNHYAAARLAHRSAWPARVVIVFHGMGVGHGDDHIRTASALVVLRQDSLERLVGQDVDENRIVVMPPSVDPTLFRPHDANVFNSGDPSLGFVGRLEASKGALELPRVLRTLKDSGLRAEIEAIGHGSIVQRSSLMSLARDLGVEDRLVLLGEREASEVADRMRRWRLLLIPSYTEGYPIVVQEARATGLPVAAVTGVLPDEVQRVGGVYTSDREAYPELVRTLLGGCSAPDPHGVPGHGDAAVAWDALLTHLPSDEGRSEISVDRWGRTRRIKPLRNAVRWVRRVLPGTTGG